MTWTKKFMLPVVILAVAVAMIPLATMTGLGADQAHAAAKLKAPAKVTAVPAAQDTVKITWSKVKKAKGYTIYLAGEAGTAPVKTVKAKVKKYSVTGLEPGTYSFTVKAFKKKGKKKIYGKASAPAEATLLAPQEGLTAACSNGQFIGVQGSDGVLSFKGIPYAKAPTGDLRWKAPQAPDESSAVFMADEFGHPSVQANYPLPDLAKGEKGISWVFDGSKYTVSEDCLTLNVWTRDMNPDKKKPVMVWFHGGGFLVGSTTNDAYQLDNFCKNQDMVMISVNYRLGIFGSTDLSTIPEGKKYKHKDFRDSQNLALLDDIRALEWIQENVAAFGGDPDNVTIFGNSAGAADITILTATTNEKIQKGELFKRVIAQSGSLSLCVPDDTKDGVPGPYKKERTGEAEKLMKLTGAKNLDQLMAVPEEDIIKAYTEYYDPEHMEKGTVPMGADPAAVATLCYDNVYTPVYNDAAGLLPGDPYDLVAAGAGKDIDVMYGSNQNEWNYWISEMSAFDTDPVTFMPIPLIDNDYFAYTFGMTAEKMGEINATLTDEEKANNLKPYMELPRVAAMTNEYAKERTDAEWKEVLAALYYMPVEMITDEMLAEFKPVAPQMEADVWKNTELENDLVFRAPAAKAAADHAAAGGTGKTYMYYWAKETDQKYQKAGHASEISYVLGNPNHTVFSGTVDMALSKKVQDMWANFARTGDPSANGVQWTQYDGTNRATMTMDLDDDGEFKMVNNLYDDQRALVEPLLKYHLK